MLFRSEGRADVPFSVCVSPVGVDDAAGFDDLAAAGATDVWLNPWRFHAHAVADRETRLESVARFAAEFIRR